MSDKEVVELNVGGQIYTTTRTTLTTRESMLKPMFSGKMKPGCLDDQGRVLIDRNPQAFFYVLEFLRTGHKFKPYESHVSSEQVDVEFDFFGISVDTSVVEKTNIVSKKRKKPEQNLENETWFRDFLSEIETIIQEVDKTVKDQTGKDALPLDTLQIYLTATRWDGLGCGERLRIETVPASKTQKEAWARGGYHHTKELDMPKLVYQFSTKLGREQVEEYFEDYFKLKKVTILPPKKIKNQISTKNTPDTCIRITCEK